MLELMSGLENYHNKLFTDNPYTSPTLYMTLFNSGVNPCGTVRVSRQAFPKEIVTKATVHNRVYYDFRSNGPLLADVWVDKRSITLIKFSCLQNGVVKRR